MKPTLNLFFDFEFTSLSPDAQMISLGIVSDEVGFTFKPGRNAVTMDSREPICKSFYSEFSDFEISRCDDWVKENVVSKLKYYGSNKTVVPDVFDFSGNMSVFDNLNSNKQWLNTWLTQFSDYDSQFVCDCGSKDWEWMVQLIGEWSVRKIQKERLGERDPDIKYFKIGLPKLPSNISPVPFDLNDLIAIKKGISVREAFDLDREELAFNKVASESTDDKHNALWDAQVIKTIYNKLK